MKKNDIRYATLEREDETPYLSQIQKAIDQLGGVEMLDKFERKVEKGRDRYIVDGEEPL